MKNLTQLKQSLEDLKTLSQPEIKEELVSDNLAKFFVEAFEAAYKSIEMSNKIRN